MIYLPPLISLNTYLKLLMLNVDFMGKHVKREGCTVAKKDEFSW